MKAARAAPMILPALIGAIVLLDSVTVLAGGTPGIDAAEIVWRVAVIVAAAAAIAGLATGGRRRR